VLLIQLKISETALKFLNNFMKFMKFRSWKFHRASPTLTNED